MRQTTTEFVGMVIENATEDYRSAMSRFVDDTQEMLTRIARHIDEIEGDPTSDTRYYDVRGILAEIDSLTRIAVEKRTQIEVAREQFKTINRVQERLQRETSELGPVVEIKRVGENSC